MDEENRITLQSYRTSELFDVIVPNEEVARDYMGSARYSVQLAEKVFSDKEELWTTMAAYHAEYYAVNAFLSRLGVSCGTYSCSIAAVRAVLGEGVADVLSRHKDHFIDAQCMKVSGEVGGVLREARDVVEMLADVVCADKGEVLRYRGFFESVVG